MRILTILFTAAALLFTAACDSGGDDGKVPTASELTGIWANLDAGQWRVFEFAATSEEPELAGKTPVYTLSLYADGAAPTVVQRGTYAVTDGVLVTTVVVDVNGANAGTSFGNDISGFDGAAFTLESQSSASGSRVFAKKSAYP